MSSKQGGKGRQSGAKPKGGATDKSGAAGAGGPTDGPVVGGKPVNEAESAEKRTSSGARPGGSAVPLGAGDTPAPQTGPSTSATPVVAVGRPDSSSKDGAEPAAVEPAAPQSGGAPARSSAKDASAASTPAATASAPVSPAVAPVAASPSPAPAPTVPAPAPTAAPDETDLLSSGAPQGDVTSSIAGIGLGGSATPVGGATTKVASPAGGKQGGGKKNNPLAPRRVKLTISRVDPWSVMKMSFLLSVAIGIGLIVTVIVLWMILDGQGVFESVDSLIKEVLDSSAKFDLNEYVELSKVVSVAAVLAVADIVILTALGTLGAFLYNIVAALVGGVHMVLTDD